MNQCSLMKLDDLLRNRPSPDYSQYDSDEEDSVALSKNWRYQRKTKNWSRILGENPTPTPTSPSLGEDSGSSPSGGQRRTPVFGEFSPSGGQRRTPGFGDDFGSSQGKRRTPVFGDDFGSLPSQGQRRTFGESSPSVGQRRTPSFSESRGQRRTPNLGEDSGSSPSQGQRATPSIESLTNSEKFLQKTRTMPPPVKTAPAPNDDFHQKITVEGPAKINPKLRRSSSERIKDRAKAFVGRFKVKFVFQSLGFRIGLKV